MLTTRAVKPPEFLHKPRYAGLKWLGLDLPTQCEAWQARVSVDSQGITEHQDSTTWQWPDRDICVLADLHADADALLSSLVASGYVERTGPMDSDFKLRSAGKKTLFLINGDCFDKGPSNLRLIRTIGLLKKKGATLKIIAGNHDVRFYAGMKSLGKKTQPAHSHFFLRMAPKGVTFLKEIYSVYLERLSDKKRSKYGEKLSANKVRAILYPGENWEKDFPKIAADLMKPEKISKEIFSIRQKQVRFEELLTQHGMTLGMAYAAANKWRELFLEKKGEFYWFFNEMKLLHTEGSFLFAHAGIDDSMSRLLAREGHKKINKRFQASLNQDMFELYFSPLGNVFRSKYREGDYAFTESGAQSLMKAGIHSIVHGHVNHYEGQELTLRHGIYNFECDTSLDYGTRCREGLTGRGAAATVFKKQGYVFGVSVDYPKIKVFAPEAFEVPLAPASVTQNVAA